MDRWIHACMQSRMPGPSCLNTSFSAAFGQSLTQTSLISMLQLLGDQLDTWKQKKPGGVLDKLRHLERTLSTYLAACGLCHVLQVPSFESWIGFGDADV